MILLFVLNVFLFVGCVDLLFVFGCLVICVCVLRDVFVWVCNALHLCLFGLVLVGLCLFVLLVLFGFAACGGLLGWFGMVCLLGFLLFVSYCA